MNHSNNLSIALEYYRSSDFYELFCHCEQACPNEIENIELWKLYGIAAGNLGNAQIARICAETVYRIEPIFEPNGINLISAYLQNGELTSACELINTQYMEVRSKELRNYFCFNLCEARKEYGTDFLDKLSSEAASFIFMKLYFDLVEAKVSGVTKAELWKIWKECMYFYNAINTDSLNVDAILLELLTIRDENNFLEEDT